MAAAPPVDSRNAPERTDYYRSNRSPDGTGPMHASDDGYRSVDHTPREHRKTEIHVDRNPDGSLRELRRQTVVHEKPDGSQVVTSEETRVVKGAGDAHGTTATARATATRPPRPVRREPVREVYERETVPVNLWGPARIVSLCVGTVFAAIGLAQAYLYSVTTNWVYQGSTLLVGSLPLAILHGAVGLIFLAGGMAYEGAAKGIVRMFGALFALGAIAGLLGRAYLGELLSLETGLFPWSLINLYAFTAVVCLIAGFAPRMNATRTIERKIEPQDVETVEERVQG